MPPSVPIYKLIRLFIFIKKKKNIVINLMCWDVHKIVFIHEYIYNLTLSLSN